MTIRQQVDIEKLDIHFTGADKRYTLRQLTAHYDDTLAEVRGNRCLND